MPNSGENSGHGDKFMNIATSSQIWYAKSAKDWNEALPIGNGRLGGMIFCDVEHDHIQLNEDSIWYGGPLDRNNPDAFTYLPQIRQLIQDGRITEAERLTRLALTGVPDTQRHYEVLGDLFLQPDHSGSHEAYRRTLDLETAIVSVQYRVGGVTYQREYFASAPHQVIVIRLSADSPGQITMTARLCRQGALRDRPVNKSPYLDVARQIDDNGFLIANTCGGENAVRFYGLIKAKATGGTITQIGQYLRIEEADEAFVILGAATSFYQKNPLEVVTQQVNTTLQTEYKILRAQHVEDYQRLYQRVSLSLGDKDFNDHPTNQRLQRVAEGTVDLGLIAQYFQLGRYLLISCSRPGTLAANLQGIWNAEWLPPWDSKYTININTEMNYFPAETCHLAECHQPLFDHIERMREPGRVTAQKMYGCRGFTAHHNTDIWADTAPQDEYIPATYWPMGAAWLCTQRISYHERSG
jgi:alpha-L-fucosidase 2